MAEQLDPPLKLSTKVSRLFATFHSRTEDEQTNDSVAAEVGARLGRTIGADHIEAIRSGHFDGGGAGDGGAGDDIDLLTALAEHFQVPPAYLTATGPAADSIDRQLRLLIAARDAGVKSLALRGHVDATTLTHGLSALARQESKNR